MTTGTCHCGCGGVTHPAKRTDARTGAVAGEPARYLTGHQRRRKNPDYIEDRHGCWIWQGCKDSQGYGNVRVDGKTLKAHRHYYEQANGPIPEGKQLDHLCRVRSCVNPRHLEPVSQAVNVQRGLLARLNLEEARAILAARGKERATDLAERFGVSYQSVYRIWNGHTWKQLHKETCNG